MWPTSQKSIFIKFLPIFALTWNTLEKVDIIYKAIKCIDFVPLETGTKVREKFWKLGDKATKTLHISSDLEWFTQILKTLEEKRWLFPSFDKKKVYNRVEFSPE